MTKFCPNCGSEIKQGSKFCQSCGTNLEGEGNNTTQVVTEVNNDKPNIQEKNIATAIILSLVTCGIYGIIWFISMNDDANAVSDDENKTSGGLAFLLSLITCGIYYLYWSYTMGQKLYKAGQKYNKDIQDNSLVYLLLSLFGLSIVSECLIQNDLNKLAR